MRYRVLIAPALRSFLFARSKELPLKELLGKVREWLADHAESGRQAPVPYRQGDMI